MAELVAVYRLRQRQRASIQKFWRLRDRDNPFEIEDSQFVEKFRLSKAATLDLCREIETKINVAQNGYAIEMQVCKMSHRSAVMYLFPASSSPVCIKAFHFTCIN